MKSIKLVLLTLVSILTLSIGIAAPTASTASPRQPYEPGNYNIDPPAPFGPQGIWTVEAVRFGVSSDTPQYIDYTVRYHNGGRFFSDIICDNAWSRDPGAAYVWQLRGDVRTFAVRTSCTDQPFARFRVAPGRDLFLYSRILDVPDHGETVTLHWGNWNNTGIRFR
jgi:hypothetical protein